MGITTSLSHHPKDAMQRLATAVLLQAIKDATSGRGHDNNSARNWLLRDEDGFGFWCSVLRIDPLQLRAHLAKSLVLPQVEQALETARFEMSLPSYSELEPEVLEVTE